MSSVSERTAPLAGSAGWASCVVTVYAVWILVIADHGWAPVLPLVVATGGAARLHRGSASGTRRFGVRPVGDGDGVCRGGLFAALYPQVLVSSTDPANSLTVANAASADYALTVMSVVALVFFPSGAALPGLVVLRVPSSAEYLGQVIHRG